MPELCVERRAKNPAPYRSWPKGMIRMTQVTEQSEGLGEREPIRKLVNGCEELLDNPFAVAIAEAALSPTSADKHMTELGWPNPIAAAVRNMVRLKVHYPDYWKVMVEPTQDPVKAAYCFDQSSQQLSGVQIESAARFGSEEYRRGLPLLLCQMSNNRGNSFYGSISGRREVLNWAPNDVPFSGLFERMHDGCLISKAGKDWKMEMIGQASGSNFRMSVNTATLKQNKGKMEFPNFYFLLQITNQLDQLPVRFERLRFLIHEDIGPGYTLRIGRAAYQRVVVLNAQHNTSTETAKLLVLEQPYFIRYLCQSGHSLPSYSLVTEANEGPQLSFTSGNAGFSGGKIFSAEDGVDALLPTMLRIQLNPRDREIPLETVAGESLLKNPPKELLSLLIEK